MKVAIIPARGGSKRIPNKNIRSFMGKPLIYYSIKEAFATKIFDRIIVTTDSSKIAKVAREFGAETPFMRPPELSDDFTHTTPVIKHAIQWLNDNGTDTKYCCCIYSNPFVTAEYILKGFNLIRKKNATSVIPVTKFPFNIYRSVKIDKGGSLKFIFPDKSLSRSQDLEESYHDAGQFYWWNCEKLMSTENESDLQKNNRFPIILPREKVQDIDSLEDWTMAEILYASSEGRGK